MQARSRFSGAFGADAGAITAHLFGENETATCWPEGAAGATTPAAFAYLRSPGVTPRIWHDPSARVSLVADVRLWDGPQARARLARQGHRLATEEDGELLLHLYLAHGPDLGCHCLGMYVAAIYDGRDPDRPRLLLVRDPLGGRGALYYAERRDALAFSSTLRSLRRWRSLSLEPNLATVRQYLSYAFVPGAETLIAGCRELLPGHVLTAARDRDGRVTAETREYWSLRETPWDDDAPVERYAGPLRALLEETVADRLPRSGPTAVLLSGGLDSSAITALAARAAPGPVHTFSINFGPPYPNELAFSGLVARHCRTAHTILTVSGADIAAHLEETTARLDSPVGDPLTVPNFLLDRAASQVSDVVLNGEGGDPCFGGPKNLPMLLHELYGDADGDRAARERNYLRSYQKCYDDLPRLLTPRVREWLKTQPPQETFLTPFFEAPQLPHYLNRLMNINVRLKGSHQILFKVDRMTAAWGVEGRSPLFDRRVVQFSFGVPPQFKQAGTREKFVLKKAVWDLLPEPILTRPKSGMLVPVQGWFRRELRAMAADVLLGRRARRRDILDLQVVKEWLAYRESPFPRHGVKLWLLLSLELYFRAFLDPPRSAPVLIRAGSGL